MSVANKREWSEDVERVLEAIRSNSVMLANYHKERYYYYKAYLKYFKLPLIALSSLTSIASVGLSEYVAQKTVSLITCILSLISATIASVELYLGIQKTMETEMLTSRNFMLLAYDIYRVLSLERVNRVMDGKHYLDEKYNDYSKLIETANLVKKHHITDELTDIPYFAPFRPKSNHPRPHYTPISSTETFIDTPPDGLSNTLYSMSAPNYAEASNYSLFSSGDASSDADTTSIGIDEGDMLQLPNVYKDKKPNTEHVPKKSDILLVENGEASGKKGENAV